MSEANYYFVVASLMIVACFVTVMIVDYLLHTSRVNYLKTIQSQLYLESGLLQKQITGSYTLCMVLYKYILPALVFVLLYSQLLPHIDLVHSGGPIALVWFVAYGFLSADFKTQVYA